jgi:gamma-glutamyl-gamma-aminobutyrate hydrolase PuuD
MSHRPLVALTTSFDPSAGSYGRPQVVVYGAYVSALDAAGLAVVLVSPSHSPDAIAALLSHCHGLALSGGGDLDPELFGEAAKPGLDSVSRERDQAEFLALRLAMERQLPIFGICRGLQVMNVCFGGTLYQDIDRDRETGSVEHQQTGPWEARAHDVTITDGSLLQHIVGEPEIHINSFHHQAVRDVAPTLVVSGIAEDGLVEAAEIRDYPWGLGVQWHPERHEATAPNNDPDRLLFRAFSEAVLAYRESADSVGIG